MLGTSGSRVPPGAGTGPQAQAQATGIGRRQHKAAQRQALLNPTPPHTYTHARARAGCLSDYQDLESTVYTSLCTLVRDTEVLRDYTHSALVIMQASGRGCVRVNVGAWW